MERLYREGEPPSGSPVASVGELLAGFEPSGAAGDGRPFVAANMVTSLDGRAAVGGRSSGLGSERDSEMLLGLRGKFDALLVGAETLRSERYGPIVRDPVIREQRAAAGMDPDPDAVVMTRSMDLPWDCPLFSEGVGRVVVFTPSELEPPRVATEVEMVRVDGDPGVDEVIEWLAASGVRSVLCEGGPSILAQLLAAGLLDELFLTIHPVTTGEPDQPRIIEGAAGGLTGFELVELSREGDELFARYRPRR